MFGFDKLFGFILLGGALFSPLTFGGCSLMKLNKNVVVSNKLSAIEPASDDKPALPNAPVAKCEDMIGKMRDDIPGGKAVCPIIFPRRRQVRRSAVKPV